MAAVTWMWEAKAAPGRVEDLLRWARSVTAGRRAEVYRGRASSAGLVVVLLHVENGDAEGAVPLPDPPADLVAGSASAWPFEQVTAAEF